MGAPGTLEKVSAVTKFPGTRPHPTLVNEVLDAVLPAVWPTWEIETLGIEVEKIVGVAVNRHSLLLEILAGVQLLRANELYWFERSAFLPVMAVLNGELADFRTHRIHDPGELAVGMHIAASIRVEDYGAPVLQTIAAMCMAHGMSFLPPPYLSLAQPHVALALSKRGHVVNVQRYLKLFEGLTPEAMDVIQVENEGEAVQLYRALNVKEMLQKSDDELAAQRRGDS